MARWLLLLTLAFACGPDDTPQVLDARIVTTDGANPLSTGEYDRISITWAQDGFDPLTTELDLGGDVFEIPFELDPIASARVRVELTGPSGRAIGAPPYFPPLAAFGFLRIVVGEPGTCAVVARFDAREPARAESGYLRWGGFVLQFGGVAASGPSDSVTFSDLYWASAETGDPLGDLPERAGPTKATLLGRPDEDRSDHFALVISDGGVWRYQLNGAGADGERARPMTLHATASAASALARTALGVVFVAGGGDASTPSVEASRIAADRRVTLGRLLGARAFAGSAPAGTEGVVVAGGARAAGAPFAEWIDLATFASTPIAEPTAALDRRAPLVLEGERSHWIVGGTDAEGGSLTTTWILSGCPEACTLEPGPEVNLGPALRAEGLTLTDGLSVFTAVEEGGWHLEPIADLAHRRDGAGITAYESGIVFVHGGRGVDGPRLDGELCFPAELTALE